MSKVHLAALQLVPGWEEASATMLTGGHGNCTWVIEKQGHKAVLKLDQGPRAEPLNTRPAEAQIQRHAAAAGLAGDVLYVSDTALLLEYVNGTVWSAGSLDEEQNLQKLAHALRRLHSLPLTGRVFDALGAAHNYARQIRGKAVQVRDCLARIEAMPLPHNLCCCHNDLVVANIISTPELYFLDWEYACDNDPFFDLATVAAHHQLSPQRADILLDAYFDGDGARWRPQLHRQMDFYGALLWLWQAAREDVDATQVPE